MRHQDPDSVIDFWEADPGSESIGVATAFSEAFVGASHAEKPKGVNAELLQKILRIYSETAKRTVRTFS